MEEGELTGDHRHLFCDSIGGLLELGFIVRYIAEDPRRLHEPITGEPGSWTHAQHFLGVEIDVVAERV